MKTNETTLDFVVLNFVVVALTFLSGFFFVCVHMCICDVFLFIFLLLLCVVLCFGFFFVFDCGDDVLFFPRMLMFAKTNEKKRGKVHHHF